MSRLLNHSSGLRATLIARASTLSSSAHSSGVLASHHRHQQGRTFFQATSSYYGNASLLGSSQILGDHEIEEENEFALRPLHYHHFQQVRWKRKDGARFHGKSRVPSRKEQKKRRRHLAKLDMEANKHGKPGSKAGPRRQYQQEFTDEFMKPYENPTTDELEGYDMQEAMLDTLVGSTKDVIDTPIPRYLGHAQQKIYNKVADQMDEFRRGMDLIGDGKSKKDVVDISDLQMPNDKDVALAIRAYRDRYGTRQKPIGLPKALSHLLQDLGVPLSACKGYTFDALLSCCRTPKEGKKVFDLMKKQGQEKSIYSWSILADIHAKIGDYEGCIEVHEEMLSEGMAPALPSYTSLFAACYKVCADSRVPNSQRAKAADVAFEQWQKMFSLGIEPDAMAYGALLRIQAARGRPEKALDILREMKTMDVTPTTLCFTSALRAVAKSHQNAIRFDRGWSRKNMRREYLAYHHGNLAKDIIILAEQAECDQDTGFVAALIECAAAAGDLASAKAIFLASQIRKFDQFRTIGTEDHQARLRGDKRDEVLALGDGKGGQQMNPTLSPDQIHAKRVEEFGVREYGKDSRVHGALLQACANAAGSNNIGTMWEGRENEGYLCENSLRLLRTRAQPQYQNRSMPQEDPITNYFDNESDVHDPMYRDGKRSGRKSGQKGKHILLDEDAPGTVDELGPHLEPIVLDEEGRLRPQFQYLTPEDVWKKKYGEDEAMLKAVRESKGFIVDQGETPDLLEHGEDIAAKLLEAELSEGVGVLQPAENGPKTKMFFNYDTMKWDSKIVYEPEPIKPEVLGADKNEINPTERTNEKQSNLFFNKDTMRWETKTVEETDLSSKNFGGDGEIVSSEESTDQNLATQNAEEEDQPPLVWESKPKESRMNHSSEENTNDQNDLHADDVDEDLEDDDEGSEVFEKDFGLFFEELKKEIKESNSTMKTITESEARSFYSSLKAESNIQNEILDGSDETHPASKQDSMALVDNSAPSGSMASSIPLGRTVKTLEFDPAAMKNNETQGAVEAASESVDLAAEELKKLGLEPKDLKDAGVDDTVSNSAPGNERMDDDMEELRKLLPMFPDERLRRILKVFYRELGTPSIIDLTLAVRETLPDYITNTWLKKMSNLTADFVVADAEDNELVTKEFLDKILALKAATGFLGDAVHFHDTEFRARDLEPSAHSDQLIIQMFLDNKRYSRAMEFKRKVQEEGREISLLAYGSLVEYCAGRDELGSALMLTKECMRIHGSIPNKQSLKKLRILLRRYRMDEDPEILELVGKDPDAWYKTGQAQRKRDRTKKDMNAYNMIRNIVLNG